MRTVLLIGLVLIAQGLHKPELFYEWQRALVNIVFGVVAIMDFYDFFNNI